MEQISQMGVAQILLAMPLIMEVLVELHVLVEQAVLAAAVVLVIPAAAVVAVIQVAVLHGIYLLMVAVAVHIMVEQISQIQVHLTRQVMVVLQLTGLVQWQP